MEDSNKKSPHTLIPPNYVTIIQLQERWLKEKERKQKEQEKKERNQEVKKPREEEIQQQPVLPIIDQPKPSSAAPGGDRDGSLRLDSENRGNARLTEWRRKNKTSVMAAEERVVKWKEDEREIRGNRGEIHRASIEGEKEKEKATENIPVRKRGSYEKKRKPKMTEGKTKESDGALHVEESNAVETKGEVKSVAKLDEQTVENVVIPVGIKNVGAESDCTVGINQKSVTVVGGEKANVRPRRWRKNKKWQANTTECEVKQNNPAESVLKLDNPAVVKAAIDDVVDNVGVESGQPVVVDRRIVNIEGEEKENVQARRWWKNKKGQNAKTTESVAKLDNPAVVNVAIDEVVDNVGIESGCKVVVDWEIVNVVGENDQTVEMKRNVEIDAKQNNPVDSVVKFDNPDVVKVAVYDLVGNAGVERGRSVVVDGKMVNVVGENDQTAEMERNVEIDAKQNNGKEEVGMERNVEIEAKQDQGMEEVGMESNVEIEAKQGDWKEEVAWRVESVGEDSDQMVEIEGQFQGLRMGKERYRFQQGNGVHVRNHGNGRYRVDCRLDNHRNRESRQYNHDGGYRGYNRRFYGDGGGYYNGGGYRGYNQGLYRGRNGYNRGGFKRFTGYRDHKEINSNSVWVRKEESVDGNSDALEQSS